jgi:hypothetical protein
MRCQSLRTNSQIDEQPWIPLVEAKPVHSKIIRAEGVTPITTAGSVALPGAAEWRDAFVHEMAEFPVGVNDDVCDAFIYAMKAFYSRDDFRKPELMALPGPFASEEDQIREELEWRMQNSISPELDEFEFRSGVGDW